MKNEIIIVLIILLSACNQDHTKIAVKENALNADTVMKAKDTIENEVENKPKSDSNILGFWTDGSTENASFEISRDSIFYVDAFSSYKYSLSGDTIKIYYSDWTFVETTSFINDTLVISSKDQDDKFWRFKD